MNIIRRERCTNFEASTAVKLRYSVFWNVTQLELMVRYRRFGISLSLWLASDASVRRITPIFNSKGVGYEGLFGP